jgi:hypothetical protein
MAFPSDPRCFAAPDAVGSGSAPLPGRLPIISADERLAEPRTIKGVLLVATGIGKTWAQNRAKFQRVNPGLSTSVVDAREKSWAGDTVFAVVPTLARPANLTAMPALDLLVIDEAHHAAAEIYQRIIETAYRRNPDLKLYGVTATPNHGDKRGLRPIFSKVADQIRMGELIAAGNLVRPRTFVIDVGVQSALAQVKRKADDFDMSAVNAIMNCAPVTDRVIRHWREQAADRRLLFDRRPCRECPRCVRRGRRACGAGHRRDRRRRSPCRAGRLRLG